jgi:hypothetical protein
VQVDQAGLLRNVNLAFPILPVFLTGSIAGAQAHERIGVVVNSHIRAVTTTYSDAAGVRFAAIVPPHSLRQGSNSVALVALEGASDVPRLVNLGRSLENFTLVERDGRELIVEPGGKEIPIEDGVARGFVDNIDLDGAVVSGWAANPAAKRAADQVIVFAGRRFLGSASPTEPRTDLAEPVGSWATGAGFHAAIPSVGVSDEEVRVFALADGRASELER